MAKIGAVWGIDIGQSALKALRCRPSADNTKIEADAFDYIEYPKILSQADAVEAPELVHEALKQFLSRNSVRGDKVVMSAAGQSGLARFIKLPPVESKKIPDIVRYEAKQQIPFPLEEVVWDYQQMAGGSTDDGFALEAEVGLFAMKRDQVYRTMKPFDRVDVEVDIIQLTPLALYNYICFDQLTDLPPPDLYDPEDPPKSVVVLSLGTDTTDLVVTNGYRVWQRSVPIGGSHFTKALTKDLKLNFATAEHLKRNASQAEDPKALFQAMRPVFNDLLTEVQRSLGYFKNMDKKATIGRVVALGNVMRLPGLQRYLAQNLGYELAKVDSFRGLTGSGIVDAPAFKENLLAFGVCYGLCLQGLNVGRLGTNLLPREIMQYRMIRAKKPWAVAAAAALLLGCGVSYFRHWSALETVSLDKTPGTPNSFYSAKTNADGFINEAGQWRTQFDDAKAAFAKTDEVGKSFLQNVQGRARWLEFLKAVNLCLPRDEGAERPKEIAKRNEIKIDSFESQWVEDLSSWWVMANRAEAETNTTPGMPAGADPMGGGMPQDPSAPPPMTADQPVDGAPPAAPVEAGPTGSGWVFKIRAHHYHNEDQKNQGTNYVRNTLLANLKLDEVPVPVKDPGKQLPTKFPVKKLGIEYPLLVGKPIPVDYNLPPPAEGGEEDEGIPGMIPGGGGGGGGKKAINQRRLNFTVEFCWRPPQTTEKPPTSAPTEPGQQASN